MRNFASYDNAGFRPGDSRSVSWGSSADDADVCFRIQYIGAQNAADVEVNAGGQILLKHGAVGATAADTLVSTDGTIDVTGGTEDTVGEVLNIINASVNWRAIHVDALLADSVNNVLLDSGPSDAKVAGGLAICWDTDAAFMVSHLVAPDAIRDNIEVYYDSDGNIDYDLPFKGTRAGVTYLAGVGTFASGVNSFQLHSESPRNAAGVALSTAQIYYDLTGATTVFAVAAGLDNLGGEIVGKLGERVVARFDNDSVLASVQFQGNGRMFRSLS